MVSTFSSFLEAIRADILVGVADFALTDLVGVAGLRVFVVGLPGLLPLDRLLLRLRLRLRLDLVFELLDLDDDLDFLRPFKI